LRSPRLPLPAFLATLISAPNEALGEPLQQAEVLALAIVKPETVVAWHRADFRLFWTWKVRHGQRGRPVVLREVRDLIRKMCRKNPLWGAPRIHGELLKLGFNIAESRLQQIHGPPKQSALSELADIP